MFRGSDRTKGHFRVQGQCSVQGLYSVQPGSTGENERTTRARDNTDTATGREADT